MGIGFVTLSAMADDKWDISTLDMSKLPPASDKPGLTYAKDIRPLFEASCLRCHGEEKQKGGLRLDSLEAVLKGGEDGKMVVAGDSKKSLLVASVAQIDPKISMPPKPRKGPRNRPPGAPAAPGAPEGTNSAHDPKPEMGGHEEGHGPGGPDGPGGPGGPGGGPGKFGPPAKPLTPEQAGIVRAWVDQGAK